MKNGMQGFTLLELLIVIVIIGILAAVLIPNLLSSRSRAYDAVAQNCTHEIGMKQEIYQVDNRTYASTGQLVGDYAPKCDSQVTWKVDSADTAAFSATAHHPTGKKTFVVSPSGLTFN